MERCYGKSPEGDAEFGEAFGALRRFGVVVVREALDDARAANPLLAIRPVTLPEASPAGLGESVPALEAQKILDFLRFGPLEHDGRIGPLTRASLRSFQDEVGIEPDGVLDMRTGCLLRNAALNPCALPVSIYSPGAATRVPSG
ncbi:MAG: peptidoglycan-binding protein [Deltaproteobacteria bacterium]|jgi:peptidoglycan hydrolase-like protein with peptidoglycan-binding domain|nr:peptidoglycan-binding protein [Deltaproteobacteria bacterium]